MDAVVLVAHPDDCVIFAWPFVEAHPELSWSVVYLTYTKDSPRGKELSAYWDKRTIPTQFLGFTDDWEYVKNGELGFDPELAANKIVEACKADLILTHHADGDYGHVHHKFVSKIADTMDIPKVYFASTFNYNTVYSVTTPVNANELPIHKEVIEQFQDRDKGMYIVTPEADTLLKKNK